MKAIVCINPLFISALFFGCEEESNPTTTQIAGKYTGAFTITQEAYAQQGTVIFNFSDSTYEQDGQTDLPTIAKISDKGTFVKTDGNYKFNVGRELQMAVYPVWSLEGTFNYQSSNNTITLVRQTSTMRYEIQLHKIN